MSILKRKVIGKIPTGGESVKVDEQLSDTSTNPVQNKVVKQAIDQKVSKNGNKVLSDNNYSNEEKQEVAKVKNKQDTLVSGQNIKTINGQSVLGSGNIQIEGGGGNSYTKQESDAKYQPKGNYATDQQLANKVDKVTGKGLSTNDYTNEDKEKVAAALTSHQDISGKADKATTLAGYGITDGYTKTEGSQLYNLVTETLNEQDDKIEMLNGSTVIVVDTLPGTGEDNVIYRVPEPVEQGESPTKYTDYGWNGTEFKKLCEYPNSVDDEPIEDSRNLVTSGGVAKVISKQELEGYHKFSIVDILGHVLASINNDDSVSLQVLGIKSEKTDEVYPNNSVIVIDEMRHVLAYKNRDGGIRIVSDIEGKQPADAFEDNIQVLALPDAIASSGNKFQAVIVADNHAQTSAINDYAGLISGRLSSCDAFIHVGDIVWDRGGIFEPLKTFVDIIYSHGPAYIAVGNHDVGHTTGRSLLGISTKKYLYNIIVKPAVEKGWVKNGEYVKNNCYYYHDFTNKNTRLIILNQWDSNEVLADNQYWTPVTYNAEYDAVSAKAYAVGDYMNIPNYTEYSFRCKNAVTPACSMGEDATIPCLKDNKYQMWYSQEQLDWFCNTLKTAAALGYTCIVASHQGTIREFEFDNESVFDSGNGNWIFGNRFTDDTVDIISDIVNAYHTRTSVSKHMVAQQVVDDVHPDDTSSIPEFDFSCDFSSVENPSPVIFLHGHDHRDSIVRHSEYSDMMSLGFDKGYPSQSNYTVMTLIDGNTVHLVRGDASNSYRITSDGIETKTNVIVKINKNK